MAATQRDIDIMQYTWQEMRQEVKILAHDYIDLIEDYDAKMEFLKIIAEAESKLFREVLRRKNVFMQNRQN